MAGAVTSPEDCLAGNRGILSMLKGISPPAANLIAQKLAA